MEVDKFNSSDVRARSSYSVSGQERASNVGGREVENNKQTNFNMIEQKSPTFSKMRP